MIEQVARCQPNALTVEDFLIFHDVAKKIKMPRSVYLVYCQRSDELDAFLMWSYADARGSWTTLTHA